MSSIERNAIKKMAYLDETPLIVRLLRSEIRPDPGQPRKRRDPEKLKGLAKTMRVKQLQPILVRQVEGEDGYVIVVGEGRWLGAGINEEETGEEQYLDCILVDESNMGKIRSMQLIENLQREDMNELDVANGYRELIEIGECKNGKEVADRMGVSPATVSVFLKVLDAPEPVKKLVENGITKMDTARTLMMLAEINKGRAEALVDAALESGMLKRSDVRDAYAEEKTRAENAAAAAKAATEASNANDNAGTDVESKPEAAEQLVRHNGEPSVVHAAGHAAPPQAIAPAVQQQSAAPAPAPQTHEKPAETAPQASMTVDKGDAEKTAVAAQKTVQTVTLSSTVPTPQPDAATAPALQQDADASEKPQESPMVTADKFDVLVSIRSGSADEDRFIGLEVEYGNARLASYVVHRDPTRAWVQFGTKDHEYTSAFNCGDLELVKVVQRG